MLLSSAVFTLRSECRVTLPRCSPKSRRAALKIDGLAADIVKHKSLSDCKSYEMLCVIILGDVREVWLLKQRRVGECVLPSRMHTKCSDVLLEY
jgi:hypothetical protein